jgi:hypothetical protein
MGLILRGGSRRSSFQRSQAMAREKRVARARSVRSRMVTSRDVGTTDDGGRGEDRPCRAMIIGMAPASILEAA